MELDDPQVTGQMSAEPAPPQGWMEELELKVAQLNSQNPQRENAVRRAFAAIREGLGLLAAHGHQMHLVESLAAPPVAFPQMLYKGTMEMTVHSSADRDTAMADGWVDHPSKTGVQNEVPRDEGDAEAIADDADGGPTSPDPSGSEPSGAAEDPAPVEGPAREPSA